METSSVYNPSEPQVEPPRSLAPDSLFRPLALLLLWVVPLAVLLFLNLQGYWLVEGNMNQDQHRAASLVGAAGLANLLLACVSYILCRRRNKLYSSSPRQLQLLGVFLVSLQVAYLWLAVYKADEVLPRSVSIWIYSQERYLFNQFTFAMLPLALGILLIAAFLPLRKLGPTIAINLGLVIGCPVAIYLGVQLSTLVKSPSKIVDVVIAAGLVLFGVLLFVGLVRGLLLALRALQSSQRVVAERVSIFVFAFLLPVGGLILNRSIPFPVDLQAWEVYALVGANAAILLYSSFKRTSSPKLCYALLCLTFPFSLYFFIVFLPFTPLSILALVLMGAGFLVLAPIILFVLHGQLLVRAQQLLRERGEAPRNIIFIGLACGMALPGFFTVRGVADKIALNAALDYVYAPAITNENLVYASSIPNLARALRNHRSYKNGIYYPLLSDYYSWVVFNNLVLPDDKLVRLEQTFLGTMGSSENRDLFHGRASGVFGGSSVRQQSRMPQSRLIPQSVKVSQVQIRSIPNLPSSMTLSLTLENTAKTPAEYVKSLPLPSGAFVNGFRLSVGGVSVPGQIFEKKTALWVYTMIRDSERRDPGILYYTTPTDLELRAFPVNYNQPMMVEIDYLLPAPVEEFSSASTANDPADVLRELGRQLTPKLIRGAHGILLSGDLQARELPRIERESYLHLIIDGSDAHGWEGDLAAELRGLRSKFPSLHRARITRANYDVVDVVRPLTEIDELIARPPEGWKKSASKNGGLALDLALSHALRLHRDLDLDSGPSNPNERPPPRPVFVLLSHHPAPRPIELKLAETWADGLDPLELYEWGDDHALVALAAPETTATPLLRVGRSVRPYVSSRNLRFAPGGADDVLMYWSAQDTKWQPIEGVGIAAPPKEWSQAVALQFEQEDYARSPGGAKTNLKALVQASRTHGILLPNTSYIVVENSAQWKMLQLSERRKLGQNAALDFLETPAPPSLYVAFGFGAWMGLRRLRKRYGSFGSLGPRKSSS